MRAMPVVVIPELEQLVFEIYARPEHCAVQILPANRADQPFHKWMRQRNVGHRFDFGHVQDSQIGSPSLKEKKRIMIGAEALRHSPAVANGMIEHAAECHAVDRSGLHPKAGAPARVLIHDNQNLVSPQRRRLATKQIHTPETVLDLTQESQP